MKEQLCSAQGFFVFFLFCLENFREKLVKQCWTKVLCHADNNLFHSSMPAVDLGWAGGLKRGVKSYKVLYVITNTHFIFQIFKENEEIQVIFNMYSFNKTTLKSSCPEHFTVITDINTNTDCEKLTFWWSIHLLVFSEPVMPFWIKQIVTESSLPSFGLTSTCFKVYVI